MAQVQKTMSEKEMFLQTFQREIQTTLKLLKAYPPGKAELKPAEKSRSARELAWVFVTEQGLVDMAIKGKIDFTQPSPQAPSNYTEILTAVDKASRDTVAKVSKLSDDQLNKTIQFPVGPGKMGDFRVADILWMTVQDQVHHRGQFSVYLRLAGAKVPSIYGPTADETWM
jgi:uncharacterized damage-inducible protein DinB